MVIFIDFYTESTDYYIDTDKTFGARFATACAKIRKIARRGGFSGGIIFLARAAIYKMITIPVRFAKSNDANFTKKP